MNTQEKKDAVKKSYGEIAQNNNTSGCCSDSACCPSPDSANTMAVDYSNVEGYEDIADLSLGCGIPTEIANIQEGNTVVDLGSGAGNDVFVARRIVGEQGHVIGIDITPEMVQRAKENKTTLGYENVNFYLNDIENMAAVQNSTADVVISNCVMNLVPDKKTAFEEVHRILKEGGHFSISDIVYQGVMPKEIFEAAEMYAGCIGGAVEKGEYLATIKAAGFKNIQIKKERLIELSDELLLQHTDQATLKEFRDSNSGVYSITVYADKLEEGECCEVSDAGCCVTEADNKSQDTTSCCGSDEPSTCC